MESKGPRLIFSLGLFHFNAPVLIWIYLAGLGASPGWIWILIWIYLAGLGASPGWIWILIWIYLAGLGASPGWFWICVTGAIAKPG